MNTPPLHNTDEAQVDELLDSHAKVYTRATMQYITDEIDEAERDRLWEASDKVSKSAILSLLAEARTQMPIEVYQWLHFNHKDILEDLESHLAEQKESKDERS